MQVTDASEAPGTHDPPPSAPCGWSRLAGFRATPAGTIIVLATVAALAVRIGMLTRPGYLRGITEYDDGVYLGAAIRLTQGVLPYKDFAFVQPPGILLLMAPVAAVARIFTTVEALALARLLTALASAACVPLAGRLVRHRGRVVTLVTCGVLAVCPTDLASAHTLLLEPWMNLCCLLAAGAAFRRGDLARPRRLAVAGIAFGFATAVKFWAALPAAAVLILCLLTRRRPAPPNPTFPKYHCVSGYAAGLAAGLLVPVLPFLLAAPAAFWHSTVADQAMRTGAGVPLAVRVAFLTGSIDILNRDGRISLDPGAHAMYAAGASPAVDLSAGVGWLPYAVAALLGALVAAGYAGQRRRLTHLEWLALVIAALAATAVCAYSAFFYHYPDFPAPWLAITLGTAAGALEVSAGPGRRLIRPTLGAITALLVAVALLQFQETRSGREPEAGTMAHLIPAGSCVLTDEVSLTIAAGRFTASPPGCPVIVDAFAETLVHSHGVSAQGGASRLPAVVARWRTWLGRADYVWLSPAHNSSRRIPWTLALTTWFNTTFTPVGPYSPGTGQLYQRTTSPVR